MNEISAVPVSHDAVALTVNGAARAYRGDGLRRLADVLRDEFGLTGTKIGCNAGDCGACTVLLDGEQVCACLVPVGQCAGAAITTVEGLGEASKLNDLQRAFLTHGAAQCGICTPGMLMAASDLLARSANPSRAEIEDALGGVLCRCTGYQKIVEAVLDVARPAEVVRDGSVGASTAKVDGPAKLTGTERYGADAIPADALYLRVIRSPHASARFTVGDLDAFVAARPGLERALTARDVPTNLYGIYPTIKDQPVLADGLARYRGDPVVALVGSRAAIEAIRDEDVPITYEPLPRHHGHRGGEGRDADPRGQGQEHPGRRRRNLRRCRGRARQGGARRRGRIPDQLRRARLYRAGGRLGRAQGRHGRSARLDPESVPASRRPGADPEPAEAGGAPDRERGRRRLRRQARSQRPSAGRAGGVAHRTSRWPTSTPGRRAWPPPPSVTRHWSRRGSAAMRSARSPASGRMRSWIPAPMRAGARPSPIACRSMRPAPMSCPMPGRAAPPISPTARRPARSAASACRRARSPARRRWTSWPTGSAWTGWSSAGAMRSRPAMPPSPARCWRIRSASSRRSMRWSRTGATGPRTPRRSTKAPRG